MTDNTKRYEIYANDAQIEIIERFLKHSTDLNREYARRMEENYKRALEEMRK